MKTKELVLGAFVLAVLSSCDNGLDSPSSVTLPDVGGGVTAEEALDVTPGIVVVFVESDFSSTNDIVGFGWEPGTQATLEVDYGDDGSVDYTRTSLVGEDDVRFQDYLGGPIPFAATTEGDRVTIIGAGGEATHVVQLISFGSVDFGGDRVCGHAREGAEVFVRVFDPELPFPEGEDAQATADATDSWCADFSGSFDIVPESWGWAVTPNGNGHTQLHWTAPSVLPVLVDIKPGSDPNSVNCAVPNELISVAILTTDDFDATTVDHATVTFEGASEVHVDAKTGEPRRHEKDVDGDGDADLVFHFRLGETSLTCEATGGVLTGETFDGTSIQGTDAIRMIG